MDTTLISIGGRLRRYLKHKGYGVNEFGGLTKTSGAQISNILKGKNYGISKLINIIEYCKDLDLDWLLKGDGEMIMDGPGLKEKKDIENKTTSVNEALLEENGLLKKEMDNLKSKIGHFEGVNTYKDLTIEAYKTTIEVLLSSNKDLKEFLEHLKTSAKEETNSRKTA